MPRHKQNPIDFHVGARLRLRRMTIGMTQEQLGDVLEVSFQQIQKYEKGMSRVGASQLFEFARALGVSVDYFYTDLPSKGCPATARSPVAKADGSSQFIMDFVNSAEGLGLNRAYASIKSPKLRRRIFDLVRDMAAQDEE